MQSVLSRFFAPQPSKAGSSPTKVPAPEPKSPVRSIGTKRAAASPLSRCTSPPLARTSSRRRAPARRRIVLDDEDESDATVDLEDRDGDYSPTDALTQHAETSDEEYAEDAVPEDEPMPKSARLRKTANSAKTARGTRASTSKSAARTAPKRATPGTPTLAAGSAASSPFKPLTRTTPLGTASAQKDLAPKREPTRPLIVEDDDDEEPVKAKPMTLAPAEPEKFKLPKHITPRPGAKLTPLETQVQELQRRYHPKGIVLMIECGYKYRFFGQDAKIAREVLHIYAGMDRNYLTSSIPVQRLPFHARRLVSAGHKVGVVGQTETAALKKQGATRYKVFERKLTALYTRGTLVGTDIDGFLPKPRAASSEDEGAAQDTAPIQAAGTLLCLLEHWPGHTDESDLLATHDQETPLDCPEIIRIAMVAVRASTGDAFYDEFSDKHSRNDLETRLAHTDPVEILVPHRVSPQTLRSLNAHRCSDGSAPRIERLPHGAFVPSVCSAIVAEHFSSADTAGVRSLPAPVTTCLGATLGYLRDFGLDSAVSIHGVPRHLMESHSLQLSSIALENLEIFSSQSAATAQGQADGSLFTFLNRTRTPFGARLLRRWVAQPLRSAPLIQRRQDAVTALAFGDATDHLDALSKVFSKLPDLERGLCRVHYCKCAPRELYSILTSFALLAESLEPMHHAFARNGASEGTADPSLLVELFDGLEPIGSVMAECLASLCAEAVKANDRSNIFVQGVDAEIDRCKEEIAEIDERLQAHLAEVRKLLRRPSLQYKSVLNYEYLVELPNTECKNVPKDWVKMSSTRAVSRFHTPTITAELRRLAEVRETLQLRAAVAWNEFLRRIAEYGKALRACVHCASVLDALMALASVARGDGYTRPVITDPKGTQQLVIENGRHPTLEAYSQQPCVPNSAEMASEGLRAMIVTGPNMGGKSSYIRQIALTVLLAQIGSYVPADRVELTVFDAIYSRMGASDNLARGRSTFLVEMHEAAEILNQATPQSLVILDELGRGTATHDGTAIAYAALSKLVQMRCLTLFVTHYPLLCNLEREFPGAIQSYHMSFLESRDPESAETRITFLYKVQKGVANRSYGLNVARLAGIPSAILQRAAEKSRMFEGHIPLWGASSLPVHEQTKSDDSKAIE